MAPANLSTAGTALGTFSLSTYVQDSGLGDLVAANYFQVENGVATMTVRNRPSPPVIADQSLQVAATSAVVSSTLAGFASSTATGSMAGSMTGSMTGSKTGSMTGTMTGASGSTSAAASSSSKASSGGRLQFGWAGLIGAMGVVGTVIGAGLGF